MQSSVSKETTTKEASPICMGKDEGMGTRMGGGI